MVDYTFIRKDVVKRVNVIEGVIEVISPLRIGAGKGDFDPASVARDQVLKDSRGIPVIPGSSWKGVFRSTGERIARERGLEVCSGVGRDNCLELRKLSNEFQQAIPKDKSKAIDLFWRYTCINCKTFGTMSVVGSARFLDSYPLKDEKGNYLFSLGSRTMVAISRTEGAAARRALVTVEFVEPGSKFNFKVIGQNLPNYVLGYLIKIMKWIHDGYVQIGGHKSRGFGLVKFERLTLKNEGVTKVGDEDKEVSVEYNKEFKGDEFFEKMRPLIEVFDSAKIPYPEGSLHK
jgi:CRISPR-associated RAMP protein (TIGR02581 family)